MDASEYRPGLEGVVAGISGISEVDADKNQLLYRGYDIHGLVQHCDFDEVAYLLLHEELPTESEYRAFRERVGEDRAVPEPVFALLRAMPGDAHPMDRLQAAVAALATFLPPSGSTRSSRPWSAPAGGSHRRRAPLPQSQRTATTPTCSGYSPGSRPPITSATSSI
jgi:citrate synthase